MNQLAKNQKILKYEIIYKQNKNTYLRVKDDYVVITTNKHIKHSKIIEFLYERFDQLYEKINEKVYESDHQIALWGQVYDLSVIVGSRFSYKIEQHTIYVISKKIQADFIKKQLYVFELARKLAEIKEEIVTTISKEHIFEKPIKIKYLRSKFGSYHRIRDEITLNSFLARLEDDYLKYVLYHEYAHVLVFNHSKAFYNVLEKLMPSYRVYHNGLKKIAIT